MTELLAPAGDMKKLLTALHFGADAVYFAGKKFGLRAYAGNFSEKEMKEAVEYTHKMGKKAYITVNIFPSNRDFGELTDYLRYLEFIGADGILISDLGLFELAKKTIKTDLHVSTQANITNKYTAKAWCDLGAKRVVLARELSLTEVAEIADYIKDRAETEVFVHGAMCISYSGRCLLSSYLSERDSNRGECVQACRWEYALSESTRPGKYLGIGEDERGSYILNSKDLNTLPILDKIIAAGVSSLKIEGRMKSEYYVGCVVNAYRKRMDGGYVDLGELYDETLKVNHRDYTMGFFVGKGEQCYSTSKPVNDYRFAAQVLSYDRDKGVAEVEMRNRFKRGDVLEIVAKSGFYRLKAEEIYDEEGNIVDDCKLVQQKLYIPCDIPLEKYDIMRIKCGGADAE